MMDVSREFARSENTYLLNILCYMIELCSKLNCGNFTISVCIALVSELTGLQIILSELVYKLTAIHPHHVGIRWWSA